MQKGVGEYVSKENPLTHMLRLQKASLPEAKNKQKKTSIGKLLHCRKDSEWHKDPKERQPRTSKTLEFSLGT